MKGSHGTPSTARTSRPADRGFESRCGAARGVCTSERRTPQHRGPVVLATTATGGLRAAGQGRLLVPSHRRARIIQIRRCTATSSCSSRRAPSEALSKTSFWRRYNCVLLTGNGQPPRGVRRLARRLHEEYEIPSMSWSTTTRGVLHLLGRQAGIDHLAFESERMAFPSQVHRISSSDADTYGLPRNVGIKLNDKDIGPPRSCSVRWFEKKPCRKRSSGCWRPVSIRLDALANKDFRYLTKTYLRGSSARKTGWTSYIVLLHGLRLHRGGASLRREVRRFSHREPPSGLRRRMAPGYGSARTHATFSARWPSAAGSP